LISAGIDIGSRTVKVAFIENGNLVYSAKTENSFEPLDICRRLLENREFDTIVATGYGRHLFAAHYQCDTITEIKAFALGVGAKVLSCRTILDIGGQDIKTIALDDMMRVVKFEMNDKCSAGTGRFLEIMAMALGCGMDEFGELALGASEAAKINSMCTVFAESEVISLLSQGAKREEVAAGIHLSIITKVKSMLHRVGIKEQLVFVGGVARNRAVVAALEKTLGIKVVIPDDPQIIGAIGCAIQGMNKANEKFTG
jgi:(R)-2-hydroxyacyl-CoA dehydratese activating ATPase